MSNKLIMKYFHPLFLINPTLHVATGAFSKRCEFDDGQDAGLI